MSHFQREICENCDQNIILIGENWYVLHATITCIKKCIKVEPSDENGIETGSIGSMNGDQSRKQVEHISIKENRLPLTEIKVETDENGAWSTQEYDEEPHFETADIEVVNIDGGNRNITLEELDIKHEMTDENVQSQIRDETIDISKNHSESDTLQCSQCMETFFSKHVLQAHIIRVHDTASSRNFKCIGCGKAFASQFQLYQHQRGQIFCVKCSERFCSSSFDSHWQSCVLGEVWCNICKKSFQSIQMLRIHEQEFHPAKNADIPLLETNITFEMLEGNKIRLNLDRGGPSKIPKREHVFPNIINCRSDFKCVRCLKIFTEKHLLDYHQCDPRKYECDMCGSKFATTADLNNHHLMYQKGCETCDRKFCSIDSLRFHRRYCLSNRPKCPICSLTFSSKYSVRGHIRRVHQSHSETKESDATIETAETNAPQEFQIKKETDPQTSEDHTNTNASNNFASSSEPQCDNM